MTIETWREMLQLWSDQWLATEERFSARVRKNRWLGAKPATEAQVIKAEKRLGYQLPPSYRNFLLVTNGWSRTSMFVQRLRTIQSIEWLEIDDPQLLDVWGEGENVDGISDYAPEEYFAYDATPIFDVEHFRRSLVIADPVDGDSMIYVLNPRVVAQDGEWEAWRFAHWIPGAERFPSFALLMQSEHALFCNTNGSTAEISCGPYVGAYAPDQPRHEAKALGKGRPKPPRLTIPELIVRLEDPIRKVRQSAARQLSRGCPPHQVDNERPELVEPLGRILTSELEPDVRGAAAAMLGAYGDVVAIPLLLKALDDQQVTSSAISALFSLCIEMNDSRIGDAMVRLLKTSQNHFVADSAMNILQQLKDIRVAAVGLRFLDGALNVKITAAERNANTSANATERATASSSWFRFVGAFAFARYAENPTQELVARLTHNEAQVRAAAVAALREVGSKGPHLKTFVAPLLSDSDPAVRQQASMTLNSLERPRDIEISPKRIKEMEDQLADFLKIVPKQ